MRCCCGTVLVIVLVMAITSRATGEQGLGPGVIEVLRPTADSVWVVSGRGRRVQWTVSPAPDLNTNCTVNCTAWIIRIRKVIEAREDEIGLQLSDPVYISRQEEKFVSKFDNGVGTIWWTEVILPDYIGSGTYQLSISCAAPDVLSNDSNGAAEGKSCGSVSDGVCQVFTIYNHGANATKVRQQYERGLREEFSRWRDNNHRLASTDNMRSGECNVKTLVRPSADDVWRECIRPQTPCAITNVTDNWLARTRWQFDELSSDPRISEGVRVGNVDSYFPMTRYQSWLTQHSNDTRIQPMVFMPEVYELYPSLLDDYEIPNYFTADKDLMTSVDDSYRMDWRWIIMAPERSGSNHHVDPVNTSAWLALPVGEKKWAFYSPTVGHIPGLKSFNHRKNDYTSIDSYNWWVYTYPYLKDNSKPLECVQKTGDLFYIPSGWWHNVLNLTPTVAVTQNLVTANTLPQVLGELTYQIDANPDNFLAYTLLSLHQLHQQTYPQYFTLTSYSTQDQLTQPPANAPTREQFITSVYSDIYQQLTPGGT